MSQIHINKNIVGGLVVGFTTVNTHMELLETNRRVSDLLGIPTDHDALHATRVEPSSYKNYRCDPEKVAEYLNKAVNAKFGGMFVADERPRDLPEGLTLESLAEANGYTLAQAADLVREMGGTVLRGNFTVTDEDTGVVIKMSTQQGVSIDALLALVANNCPNQ
jgi:hypothetical protein